ncbi:CDP-diacylglycerol--glycerol-3-phosphate 3-phosphatidyltransferase [Ktedonobacter racemifer]|jgi:CDP-diacylglycerol--glycerol-3-phosphate 3-phosphatidyltransferase|uniref:CDP-diacylglycerol--glycerol-3-phosphate 3-phosphatidyltransferase n=1 Tax=Ktedonobacter racemifer DSM 44963 TaxID=485913 RepID=D6TMX3_KTERA|nr:CDP-diacylglycerol--glycerol-3-phosphate 3-phosphatidyltransferase [Ktedonobacter racemifer]EFH87123.1 CDP-diacylglycerol/glycerol-3-phosphate3-phospha tidyltransferase [Ktedonobacter racemifer DSM 44963]
MRNVPNILSISRLISTVIVFILVLVDQPWAYLVATVLFALSAVTDYFDGYLARRYNLVSSLGVFLDLTADKVFVVSILIAMIEVRLVSSWIVFIIVTREFMVSGLRSIAAARGKVIPAGKWGKQKTFITLIAIGVVLLAKGLGAHLLSLFPWQVAFNSQTLVFNELLLFIGDILLIVATIWTIFSGIEYTVGAIPIFREEIKEEKQNSTL